MTENPIRPTPNLSPPPGPPSKSDLFQLSLDSTILSTPPSTQDPRVNLRSWGTHLNQPQREDEEISLRQVRESEGRFRRLERLREVFESIPTPPPIVPIPTEPESPPPNQRDTLLLNNHENEREGFGSLEEEKDRWERERGVYMKELWKKCGAEVSGSGSEKESSTSRTTATSSNSTTTISSSLLSNKLPSPSSSSSTTKPPSNSNCLRWSSFETYADSQESALFKIFNDIDQDHDLKLNPQELSQAFKEVGLENVVEGFVRDVDRDGDGLIGWEEWRDFLILLPRKPSVKEIVHFYRSQTRSTRPSMSRLTQDGDVVIGRGKTSFNRFLSSTTSSSTTKSGSFLLGSSSSTSNPLSATSLSNLPLSLATREKERIRILAECDLHRRESGAIECRWAREEQERRSQLRSSRRTKRNAEVSGGAGGGHGLDFEGSGVVIVDDHDDDEKENRSGKVKVKAMKEKEEEKEKKALVKTTTQVSKKSVAVEKEESSIQSTPSSSSTPIPPTRTLSTPSTSTSVSSTKMQASGPIPVETKEEDLGEEEEEEEEHGMFSGAGKFLLAGGTAGAVSRTATAPFDRLKVYLITSPSSPLPPTPKPSTSNDPSMKPVKAPRRNAGSLAKAVKAVYSQGGMRSFWTGNMLNVIKIFPESAIKFLSYESAKRVFAQHWDCVPDQTLISNTSRFISGGIGGVVSQLSIYPIESLKTRVMSSTGGAKSGNALILQTFLDMYRKGGLTFFFRGLPAGLIGVFPYAAIDMSTFEGIKISYTKWAGEEPGIAGSLCFGAVSGGVGATSVYPLNLVRTRLQAQGTPAHPQVYSGIKDAAIKCYQREGWRGFYKGLTPTLVKVVPAVAISYAVYDQSKKFLFGKEDDHSISTSNDSNEEA